MGVLTILALAVGLAMDACAVSAGAGASGRSPGRRAAFRLSFHFGLFQALMPVVGWAIGFSVAGYIAAVDHWIAFGLLALVGGRMILSGLRGGQATAGPDLSRGWSLVVLSVATSIDALAVGLGLAMVGVSIWTPAAVIGVVTAALSLAGLWLGRRLGDRFGRRMEIAGGVILLTVGVRILAEHLGWIAANFH